MGGGGRGEERPVGGGEFGSLSFLPYLFVLRLPLSQSVFFVLWELPSRRITPHTWPLQLQIQPDKACCYIKLILDVHPPVLSKTVPNLANSGVFEMSKLLSPLPPLPQLIELEEFDDHNQGLETWTTN